MDFNFDYVDRVIIVTGDLLADERPNWGYVEKFDFVEKLIKSFGYLEVSDNELIERAKELLNGEDQ